MRFDNLGLGNDSPFWDDIGDKPKRLFTLDRLAQLNILVGPNNSGKSLLMRTLIRQPSPSVTFSRSKELEGLRTDREGIIADLTSAVHGSALANTLSPAELPAFPPNSLRASHLAQYRALLTKVKERAKALGSDHDPARVGRGIDLDQVARSIEFWITRASSLLPDEKPFPAVYVPVLRGLRPVGDGNSYAERTIADYFTGADGGRPSHIEVHTGQDLYTSVRKMLLGPLEQRERVREFEDELGRRFFEGAPVAILPREDAVPENTLYLKIGGEKERPVSELGDGLQQLIIITFALRSVQRGLIFIEEPELFLHPGLQRALLNCVLDACRDREHTVFVTTHSNHLLDLAMERERVSIYSVSKRPMLEQANEHEPTFAVEQVALGDKSMLDALGVLESSVFLVNATIWVEGITDRLYLQHYFELYQKHLKNQETTTPEDTASDGPAGRGRTQVASGVPSRRHFELDRHYVFVEYGGSNLPHFSFEEGESAGRIDVEHLCARALVIADCDRGKEERHEARKTALGERYRVLKCREVENLLPPAVVRAVVGDYERRGLEALGDFPACYTEEGLGSIIEGWLRAAEATGYQRARRGKYDEPSGTVTDKVRFCKRALSHLKSYDQMTQEAKDECEAIYRFVKSRNLS